MAGRKISPRRLPPDIAHMITPLWRCTCHRWRHYWLIILTFFILPPTRHHATPVVDADATPIRADTPPPIWCAVFLILMMMPTSPSTMILLYFMMLITRHYRHGQPIWWYYLIISLSPLAGRHPLFSHAHYLRLPVIPSRCSLLDSMMMNTRRDADDICHFPLPTRLSPAIRSRPDVTPIIIRHYAFRDAHIIISDSLFIIRQHYFDMPLFSLRPHTCLPLLLFSRWHIHYFIIMIRDVYYYFTLFHIIIDFHFMPLLLFAAIDIIHRFAIIHYWWFIIILIWLHYFRHTIFDAIRHDIDAAYFIIAILRW